MKLPTPTLIEISYWGDHTIEGWIVTHMLDELLSPGKLFGWVFFIKYEYAHPNPAAVKAQLEWLTERGGVILEMKQAFKPSRVSLPNTN